MSIRTQLSQKRFDLQDLSCDIAALESRVISIEAAGAIHRAGEHLHNAVAELNAALEHNVDVSAAQALGAVL